MQRNTTYRFIAKLFLLGIFYFVAGKLGLRLAFVNASTTAVWAPTGIALAAFLLYGYRVFPAILLGAFFTNLTTNGTMVTSLAIAVGNTLEGFVGAYLVNKFASGKNAFYKAQNIFKFIVLAVLLSTTISANIGVMTLIFSGLASWKNFLPIWFTWWTGDATGALIVTPFLIFWQARHPLQLRDKLLEASILFLALLCVSFSVFGGAIPGIGTSYPLEFLCIPIIIWVAFRFGRRETMTAIFILASIAIWGTLNGLGPFARQSQNESLLLLQAFMAVITVTALTLAVAVSEKRSVQVDLENSEKRFKALIEKSSEAMSLTDSNGVISYVSPSFTRVLGYSPEEVIGKSGFMLIHPDDVDYAAKITSKIVDKPGESAVVEIRCLHKDGSLRNIEITSTNLIDNPSVKAVVSNFHDITDLMKTEERIMHEKAEDEALLESIGDGIIATDNQGKIVLVNKAFEDLLYFKKDDVIGKSTYELIDMQNEKGEQISEKNRPIYLALSTGKKVTATHYLFRKDKTKFPATIVASPIILDKQIIGAIKVFHDVTKEKEIDKAKTEFVSLASHQLRTPPAIIKWQTELLLKNSDFSKLNPKQKKYIYQIRDAGERMITLVNTLLNASRLELGTFKTKNEVVNIEQIAKAVLSELSSDIKAKKLRVSEIYATNLPSIQADPGAVTIIFQNLLSNAIKYTPDNGEITIKVALIKDRIQVIVSDSGYGIPSNQQSKIFTKLFRADNITSRDTQGNGLGLYIVKSVLERMGGSISFKSEENKGTTFTINLDKESMQ